MLATRDRGKSVGSAASRRTTGWGGSFLLGTVVAYFAFPVLAATLCAAAFPVVEPAVARVQNAAIPLAVPLWEPVAACFAVTGCVAALITGFAVTMAVRHGPRWASAAAASAGVLAWAAKIVCFVLLASERMPQSAPGTLSGHDQRAPFEAVMGGAHIALLTAIICVFVAAFGALAAGWWLDSRDLRAAKAA
jgi:hypothetical protein